MILIDDVLALHDASIEDFGGTKGIRDFGLLESAVAGPFQTFGGEDLYPSAIEKAAALGESLILNHPFIDGNKRTGMLGNTTLLFEFGIRLNAAPDTVYDLIINISTGSIKFEQIVDWLKKNTSSL